MNIKTLSHDGDEELLWQLSDYSHASNDKWDMAQIYISAPKVSIHTYQYSRTWSSLPHNVFLYVILHVYCVFLAYAGGYNLAGTP